jgi:hypothetical protein
MQQIKLISKLGLAVIAITALSVAVAVHAFHYYYYSTQSTDAQAQVSPVVPNVPDNSVFTQSIVDGQVLEQDLGNQSVTALKVMDGELTAQDFRRGAITPNTHVVTGRPFEQTPYVGTVIWAVCPPGEIAVGGGYALGGEFLQAKPIFNIPWSQDAWAVQIFNDGSLGKNFTITPYAQCMVPYP